MHSLPHVYVVFPGKAPLLENVMLRTLQESHCHRRSEHTGIDPQELFSFAPLFTPLDTEDPGRQVTKLISPNNTVAGSTEQARQETLNALLEKNVSVPDSSLTGFEMLMKPTFEHADACTLRAKIYHDHRPNNEAKQGCTGHSITNHLFAGSGKQQLP